jgi:hypothetical protein
MSSRFVLERGISGHPDTGAYDYDDEDYYWVPGTSVLAPEVGFLWTPGYWAWGGDRFILYDGYWGPHVGFYSGIVYGFGYFGEGYEGGRWDNGRFFYNRSVNNVNITEIHNVYNTTARSLRSSGIISQAWQGRCRFQPPTHTRISTPKCGTGVKMKPALPKGCRLKCPQQPIEDREEDVVAGFRSVVVQQVLLAQAKWGPVAGCSGGCLLILAWIDLGSLPRFVAGRLHGMGLSAGSIQISTVACVVRSETDFTEA